MLGGHDPLDPAGWLRSNGLRAATQPGIAADGLRPPNELALAAERAGSVFAFGFEEEREGAAAVGECQEEALG